MGTTRTQWPERGRNRALCVCRLSHLPPSLHTHNTQVQKFGVLSFLCEGCYKILFPCSDHRFSLGRSSKHSVVGRSRLLPISDLLLPPHTIHFTPSPISVRPMHNLQRSNHITSQIETDPLTNPRPLPDRYRIEAYISPLAQLGLIPYV